MKKRSSLRRFCVAKKRAARAFKKIRKIMEENFEKALDKKSKIGYNVECHCVKAYFIAERRNASDSN